RDLVSGDEHLADIAGECRRDTRHGHPRRLDRHDLIALAAQCLFGPPGGRRRSIIAHPLARAGVVEVGHAHPGVAHLLALRGVWPAGDAPARRWPRVHRRGAGASRVPTRRPAATGPGVTRSDHGDPVTSAAGGDARREWHGLLTTPT